jgi:hypothetical protein
MDLAGDTSNDATIAQILNTVQQLTDIYQFSEEQANEAVEAVGPNIHLAYNYILDQGGEDRGGAIIPVDKCPHVLESQDHMMDISSISTLINKCSHFQQSDTAPSGGRKELTNEDGSCPSKENWMCLHCGVVRCSRYVNGHSKDHYLSTTTTASQKDNSKVGHCLAVSLEDLSVWCYSCEAYVIHPNLKHILKSLETLKFG